MNMDQEYVDSLLAYLKFFGERQAQIESSGNDPYAWEFLKIRIENDDQRGMKEYSSEIGSRPENMRKNRYRDILPYDHSRVKITPYADDGDSDYINASLIKGANDCIGYIATQGPMPETVNDFWQMTHEFAAKTILMLCDLFEGGKPKCHQYWPDLGSSAEYINTTVANTYETQPQEHFTVRHFTLTCYGRVTKIQQFHYHGWPDHGTPDEIEPLLDYLEAVRSWQNENDKEPIIIHCSAGCGRSGTLCALDIVRTQLKNKTIPSDFSVSRLVNELRKQRIAMVQSKDQYVLLHQTVALMFKHYLKESCGVTANGDLNGINDDNPIADGQVEGSSYAFDLRKADQQNATTVYLNGAENDRKVTRAEAASSPCRPPRSRKAALTSSIINQQRQQKPIHSDSCSSVLLCEDADRVSLTKNASSSSVFTHASNNSNRSSPERSAVKAKSKSPRGGGDAGQPECHGVNREMLLDETLKAADIDDIVFGDDTNNEEAKSDRGSRDSSLSPPIEIVAHSFSSPNLQNKVGNNETFPTNDKEKLEATLNEVKETSL